jgi:hypothetical protein
MFYFSFIFSTKVYSVEQNTFIAVFYFRNGRFINGELSVCKNDFQQNIWTTFKMIVNSHWANIVNRFLTIGTISKGKSSGRPPLSDETVEDLKEMVEKTTDIHSPFISTI